MDSLFGWFFLREARVAAAGVLCVYRAILGVRRSALGETYNR